MLPVITAKEVRDHLAMDDCIDLMTEVQAALSRGDISLPLRSMLPVSGDNLLAVMPGSLSQVFGAKLLSLFPDNPANDRPSIQGLILLFDPATGEPTALIDAISVTAIRTAAASASATRLLAVDDAHRLALLGYGVQAATHLEAMCCVRPVDQVKVWGPDLQKAQDFAQRSSEEFKLPVEAVQHPQYAVQDADLVCSVSAAQRPIIEGDWLSPGSHINLVGAHNSGSREADGATLARARVYTEITEFAFSEAGDILLAIEEGSISRQHITGEIGAVSNGTLKGRTTTEQITLYKSLGNIAQDLAAAQHVFSRNQSSQFH